MTIPVIAWSTGTVGIHAVPAIAAHPQLELVGLWVHSDDKAGKDAGELCGGDALGVLASQDIDALLAKNAQAVVYTASSDIRPDAVIDDLCRMLESGLNVANTSFVPLLYPKYAGEGIHDRLQAACIAGSSSFYTSGIDPGYGNAGLAIHTLALCKEVRTVRMMEIVNYATWDNPFTLFEIMGFSKQEPTDGLLLSPGSTALAWGPVVQLVAKAIGLELDEIVERHEVIRSDDDIEITSGTVPAGTISGMRFEIIGMAGGEEAVVVEHVTRLRDEDAPEWPQGDGYRILIGGEPNVKVQLQLSSDRGDHNHAGCLATAMHVVNAIPAVVAAEPGVLTMLDLPVYSACLARQETRP